jgi:adenosine deaminase
MIQIPDNQLQLHAHLSGSISRQTLHDIWQSKTTTLEDPLLAIPLGKIDYDLTTFFPLFSSYIYALINDVSSIERSTKAVLRDFEADGVIYLELRTTPRAVTVDGEVRILSREYVRIVLGCLYWQNSREGATMMAKLILSIDRRMSLQEAEQVVDLAIWNKAAGVVGVDICGDPTKGDISLFTPAVLRAKKAGLGITIHFAEAPGVAESELRTILDWNPSRIGHVIHVPETMRQEILRRGTVVELCLSCNVHAKMITGTYKDHHFKYWWEKRGKIAMSTDDVGIFCSPLSEEYRLVGEHFGLMKDDLLKLSAMALEAAFVGGKEKETLKEQIKNWDIDAIT